MASMRGLTGGVAYGAFLLAVGTLVLERVIRGSAGVSVLGCLHDIGLVLWLGMIE